MRCLYAAAVALVVAACTESLVSPRDAGVDAPEVVDAEVPLEDAGAPDAVSVCRADNRGTSCVPIVQPCAGGFRYGCYGGTCPTGAVGACSLISEDLKAGYTETCCELSACTRVVFNDLQQCKVRYADAGRLDGWHCPKGMKPPGDCVADSPTSGPTAEYCCR